MSLRDKIQEDYKNSVKSKDKNKISTYRLILSGIKDLDIVNRVGDLKRETDENDIKKLIKKMIKQRNESIEAYEENNRMDLAESEKNEVEVLSAYLPQQLSDEETKNICENIVKKVEATSLKDMGKVMTELRKNYSDNLDFSKAGTIIKNILNS